MSAQAAQYQTFVTGRAANQSYFLNGVKFDGIVSNVLVDAKSAGYANFVNKNGMFYDWFKGTQGFLDQARRQIQAANGAKIQWFFQEESSMKATQTLLNDNGIREIELIYKSIP